MADTKISDLAAQTTLGDTDELVLAVAGANKKITGANLKVATSGWTTVSKTTDESVTSSTTVQNDDELFFTTVTGAVYEIDCCTLYAGGPGVSIAWGEDSDHRRGTMAITGFAPSGTTPQLTAMNTSQAGSPLSLGSTTATLKAARGAGVHTGIGGRSGCYGRKS